MQFEQSPSSTHQHAPDALDQHGPRSQHPQTAQVSQPGGRLRRSAAQGQFPKSGTLPSARVSGDHCTILRTVVGSTGGVGHVLSFEQCMDARLEAEAARWDWRLVGLAARDDRSCRRYEHACKHRQDVAVAKMRRGDAGCALRLDVDVEAEPPLPPRVRASGPARHQDRLQFRSPISVAAAAARPAARPAARSCARSRWRLGTTRGRPPRSPGAGKECTDSNLSFRTRGSVPDAPPSFRISRNRCKVSFPGSRAVSHARLSLTAGRPDPRAPNPCHRRRLATASRYRACRCSATLPVRIRRSGSRSSRRPCPPTRAARRPARD